MKVLIVDHDPAVLETVARALKGLVETDTITNKADCQTLLRQGDVRLVVACERLSDGSGLDLLAKIGRSDPEVLRVFAADPERIRTLGGHLAPFKLFETVAYPLDVAELRQVLSMALAANEVDADTANVQHIVLESNEAMPEPPRPADPRGEAAAPGESVVVLARDASSLEAAKGALAGKPQRLIIARDADEAQSDVASRRPLAALVDVGAIGEDVEAWFTKARAAAPETVLLALGRRDDAKRLEPLVTQGLVHRFVSKPITQAGMRLVLDSAQRQSPPAPNGESPPFVLGADVVSSATAHATREGPNPFPSGSWPKPVLMGGLVASAVAAVLLAGWAWLGGDPSPQESGESQPTLPVDPAPTRVAPAGEAPESVAIRHIEEALAADDARAARSSLAELERLDPSNERLALLRKLVSRMPDPPAAPAPSRPTAPAPAQAPAPATAPMAPAPDPAPRRTPATGPTRLAAIAPPPGATTSVPPGMTRLTPPEPPPALPVRAPTAAATSSGSTRFTGRTVEQGPKPAEEERPEPVVFDARVTRRVAPDYPDGARRRQVEGTVEVEFTVMRDGRVSDPIVVAADPPDVFDAAAVSAVRRWRYEPRREDGVPVDHRTRARLEFRLND